MSYHLVTTADERTWKFDRPVIFLGEWCRLYERKHIWQGMDAIVAAPYGLGQPKKDADYAEARALELKVFPLLCNVLNEHHGTQHGTRFWQIVLGHWFRRYIDVMVNRVKTLQLCLQTYPICGTTAFADDRYMLIPQDSHTAIWAFNDDRWNHVLYLRILQLLGATNCHIETIQADTIENFQWAGADTSSTLKNQISKWIFQTMRGAAATLARKNDAFIINSYLPKIEEINLHLHLRQMPQMWISPRIENYEKYNLQLRKHLTIKLAAHTENKIENVIQSLLFDILPTCYLEGFELLDNKTHRLPWPKTPKFLFTSSNFDTDEVFKLWAANKVESGSKYIIGQHGNNYGTLRYMQPSIEEVTPDKFLTWGWRDGLQQHTPAFILKTAGLKPVVGSSEGGLLLVEICEPHRISVWDSTTEFTEYFQDQLTFVSLLLPSIKEQTTVRLHGGYRHTRWGEVTRWQDFDKEIQLDLGDGDIRDRITQSRLVIHSYDSTGILETLSQNIPTIAFWQNGLDHLRDSAKPYYQLLIDSGIVHLSPESAAAKVNDIWNEAETWWMQDEVQISRLRFCERYAKVSSRLTADLINLINNIP